MLNALTAIVKGVLSFLALPIAFFFKGRDSIKKELLKDENKRLKNRPRTDGDALDRLRSLSNKLKARGK